MNERHLLEAKPFLSAIAERPGDSLPRMIFADWLEERGYDREAAGQRWAAENGKTPHRGPDGAEWLSDRSRVIVDDHSRLPTDLGLFMFDTVYRTAVDAERALLRAFTRLAENLPAVRV